MLLRGCGELAGVNHLGLVIVLAVAACGGAPVRDGVATAPAPVAGRVVVVSIDGMMPDVYLDPDAHDLAIPTLRSPSRCRAVRTGGRSVA